MQDNPVPNYVERAKAGEVIVNSCKMTIVKRSVKGSGMMTQTQISNPSNDYSTYGDGSLTNHYLYFRGSPSFQPLSGVDGLETRAKQLCLSRVDSTPYSFAEDIGELRETVRFLKNPVKSWVKLSRLIRNSARRKQFRHLAFADAVASVWLEYRFAAAPLVRSMLSLMEAWEDKDVKRPERRTARATVEGEENIPDTVYEHKPGSVTYTYRYSAGYKESASAGIVYEVNNPVVNLAYKYGLRFKDIPTTMWELLPLSFMVDRIYNIKNFCSGAVNLLDPNLKILNGWFTTKSSSITNRSLIDIVESGYNSVVSPDVIVDSNFEYKRDVWVPGFGDTVPTSNIKGLVSDSTRIADLLALSVSYLGR
jgi:hypothetical protein